MMRMILRFIGIAIFHRPVSSHTDTKRSDHRIKNRFLVALEDVFCKELIVNFDDDSIVLLFKFDSGFGN